MLLFLAARDGLQAGVTQTALPTLRQVFPLLPCQLHVTAMANGDGAELALEESPAARTLDDFVFYHGSLFRYQAAHSLPHFSSLQVADAARPSPWRGITANRLLDEALQHLSGRFTTSGFTSTETLYILLPAG